MFKIYRVKRSDHSETIATFFIERRAIARAKYIDEVLPQHRETSVWVEALGKVIWGNSVYHGKRKQREAQASPHQRKTTESDIRPDPLTMLGGASVAMGESDSSPSSATDAGSSSAGSSSATSSDCSGGGGGGGGM